MNNKNFFDTVSSIKNDFPIFSTEENANLVYLDNASTTQKPKVFLDALTHYYTHNNSNVGRGMYALAERSEKEYEYARSKVASFINAKARNVSFTSGTTDSLNIISYILQQVVKPKQKIVLSIYEHHANILPWQRVAKEKDLEIIFIKDPLYLNNPEILPVEFWKDVAILSISHVSNVTGQIHPIKNWCKIAKQHNVITVIDGAQGICSTIVNIDDLDCDFYSFSAHKIYGPMGLGVLYINDKFINNVEPFRLGGGIVEDTTENSYEIINTIHKFEAGTPNVANAVAFGYVLDYLLANDWKKLLDYMDNLTQYLYQQFNLLHDIEILNDKDSMLRYSHILSFKIKNIHAHDIGTYLANQNIAVRTGKHCTYPLHNHLEVNSSVRVSLGIYNTKEDIDKIIMTLTNCINFFKGI